MSDPEDDRVLRDEIKALEDILAADETSEASVVVDQRHNLLPNDNPHKINVSSRGFGEVTPHDDQRSPVDDCKTASPKSALEANRKLLELLKESKRELVAILEKCIENKTIVDEKIKERAKNAKSTKILIGTAGMPYFKDRKHYAAPRNQDTQDKVSKGELQVVHLRYTSPWTARDRNILWKAIRLEASSAALVTAQPDDGKVAIASKSSGAASDGDPGRWTLPRDFRAMVGPLGAREFDWMKMAIMDFDSRHTAEECGVMWRVFLHPDINRYRWTKNEDATLEDLCKKYKYQDWDALAKELGTNRSGYQCFIRYNTNNKSYCTQERAWTEEEDKRLRKCVETLKIGHYVPWGVVSRYLDGRSKMQVYFRWMYNAAPHLKKGRFTADEDETLLEAVKKYGTNFGKISVCVMPHRSSVQLSDHYVTLVQRKRGIRNTWTIDDDARLVKLYKKFGSDWSKIAEKFHGKTRTQLRQRHKSILHYWEKGISLYEIPRNYEKTEVAKNAKKSTISDRCRVEGIYAKHCRQLEEVDLELIKYFQVAPPSNRPGRKQKFYKEQELKDTTRKLFVLFNALKVDFTITDQLEDRTLTEKDKQLLASLAKYQRSQIEYAKSQFNDLKYARISTNEESEDGVVHFTPLCSGDCKIKSSNARVRLRGTLDYVTPKNLDCQIKLNLELETPQNVIDRIGDEKNDEFDRLTKILKSRTIEVRKPSVVTKIYVLGPDVCAKALAAVPSIELTSAPATLDNCPRDDNEPRAKKSRRVNRGRTWNSTVSEGIIYHPDRTIDCVEPNYYTMLGLQHILSGEINSTELDDPQREVNENCTRSMEKLKKRLIQLFKYPIGLSHVLRPEIYARRVQVVETFNNEDNIDDSESAAKTKRFTNKRRATAALPMLLQLALALFGSTLIFHKYQ